MLRGNYTVRMDEKGRIKLPVLYRRYIDEHYGPEFYVTSLTGESARLYPMKEWIAIEDKLQSQSFEDESVRKFLDRTNYFGQPSEMDSQGRILVHPLLRTSAQLAGDVAVMGYLRYLEVWELELFKKRLEAEPYTAGDQKRLASLGV
jgi:MraZ protein